MKNRNYKNTLVKNKQFSVTVPLTEELEALGCNITPMDLGIDPEYVITKITRNERNPLKPTITVNAERSSELTIDKLQKVLKNISPAKTAAYNIKNNPNKKDVMAMINIYDFHLGRLAHAPEVYGHSYDTKIACNIFKQSTERVFSTLKSMPYNYDLLVLNYGGDFFNADNEDNLTSSLSHTVDCDTRYMDYFQKGVELMVSQIKTALTIAEKVFVPMVPGNHDHQSFKQALVALHWAFKDEPRVAIELEDNNRSVVYYGSNLIVLAHGVEGRRIANLPLTEPEAKQMLSKASNIEIITGHTHAHKFETKDNGFMHEICGQAAPVADAWTAENGYAEAVGEWYINVYDDNHRIAQFTEYSRDFLPERQTRNTAFTSLVNLKVNKTTEPKKTTKKKLTRVPSKKTTKKTTKKATSKKK